MQLNIVFCMSDTEITTTVFDQITFNINFSTIS